MTGFRPGIAGYHPAVSAGRYGVRTSGYYGGRYPSYGRYYGRRYPSYGGYYGRYPYYRNNYGGWGWGTAGLVTGAAIGAAAASAYPPYTTPSSSSIGGYCATPVRTCALTSPAPVGSGCSCRTTGGRARGTVVGP
jgi:hypothetical protein